MFISEKLVPFQCDFFFNAPPQLPHIPTASHSLPQERPTPSPLPPPATNRTAGGPASSPSISPPPPSPASQPPLPTTALCRPSPRDGTPPLAAPVVSQRRRARSPPRATAPGPLPFCLGGPRAEGWGAAPGPLRGRSLLLIMARPLVRVFCLKDIPLPFPWLSTQTQCPPSSWLLAVLTRSVLL